LGKTDAALVGLGAVALAQGQVEQAKSFLEQAIAAEPRNYKAYLVLGDISFAQRNNPQAIRYYQKAVSLKPDLTEAYQKMGNSYSRQGDYENARWMMEKAKVLE